MMSSNQIAGFLNKLYLKKLMNQLNFGHADKDSVKLKDVCKLFQLDMVKNELIQLDFRILKSIQSQYLFCI